jgi:cysteine-rich repeat protein
MRPAGLVAIALSAFLGALSLPSTTAHAQIVILDPNSCTDCVTPAHCGDGIVQIALVEECDDGNFLSEDGCSVECLEEFCGDGILQLGLAEQCDDGNNIDGDGCSIACQSESQPVGESRPQSKKQQRCINTLNHNLLRVSRAQAWSIHYCIHRGTRGKWRNFVPGGTIESCLASRVSSRVAVALWRTVFEETRYCRASPPDFGASNATSVIDTAMRQAVDLVHQVFGEDLDARLIPRATDKHAFKCQKAVARSLTSCQSAKLRQFNQCKKRGLRNGSIVSSFDLEGCMAGASERVAEACDPVTGHIKATIDEKCGVSDLSGLFAGCGTEDPLDLAVCLDEIVECRVCVALNEANDLHGDCDLLDDGMANLSCP